MPVASPTPPKLWQLEMSPDIAKCSLRYKVNTQLRITAFRPKERFCYSECFVHFNKTPLAAGLRINWGGTQQGAGELGRKLDSSPGGRNQAGVGWGWWGVIRFGTFWMMSHQDLWQTENEVYKDVGLSSLQERYGFLAEHLEFGLNTLYLRTLTIIWFLPHSTPERWVVSPFTIKRHWSTWKLVNAQSHTTCTELSQGFNPQVSDD